MPPKTAVPASKTLTTVRLGTPDFISAMNADYLAQRGHVFIVAGNIYDYAGNNGDLKLVHEVLAGHLDDNVNAKSGDAPLRPRRIDNAENGVNTNCRTSEKQRVVCFYDTSLGLQFPDPRSKLLWTEYHKQIRGEEWVNAKLDSNPAYFEPRSPEAVFRVLNEWFLIAKDLKNINNEAAEKGEPLRKELMFSVVFRHAEAIFPNGDLAHMQMDREAIVTARNWALDKGVGDRNRIILLTQHETDIHESIRTELAVTHRVIKPNLYDRKEWLINFERNIKDIVKRKGPRVMGENRNVTGISMAPEFTLEEFAIQSAGVSRRVLRDIVLNSWRTSTDIDFPMVQEYKKNALYAEFGGWLQIIEPKHGFEQIGGHQHFKDFALHEIIRPLKAGDTRRCTPGAVLLGPPGTGKTMLSMALAKESGVNFLIVDLSLVFGSHVGQSEKNTRRIIEAIQAAAPCICLFDEVDSVLSSGRSSAGDSGTSGRVFNQLMTWLSDPARVGRVVPLFASNRPDLLDDALIRDGRMDAKIPLLPPMKTDVVGRLAILEAQTRKHKIVLSEELRASTKNPKAGLGKLLMDTTRYWTGAEIESVMKSALRRTYRMERMVNEVQDLTVQVEDWDYACSRAGRTGDVDRQIRMALEYSKLEYVPDEWFRLAERFQSEKAERDVRRSEHLPIAA